MKMREDDRESVTVALEGARQVRDLWETQMGDAASLLAQIDRRAYAGDWRLQEALGRSHQAAKDSYRSLDRLVRELERSLRRDAMKPRRSRKKAASNG